MAIGNSLRRVPSQTAPHGVGVLAVILAATTLLVLASSPSVAAAIAPAPIERVDVQSPHLATGTSSPCGWLGYHYDLQYAYFDDSSSINTDQFVHFTPVMPGTLMAARVFVYAPLSLGTPTMRIRVYGENGDFDNGDWYPDCRTCAPGTGSNLIDEFEIPWSDIDQDSNWTVIDFTTRPNWPADYRVTDRFFISASLSPNTPDPGLDRLALTIDGGYGNRHSGAYLLDDSYYYFDDAYTEDYGLLLEAEVCYDDVPDMSCRQPDDWSTWAHDNNRSCQSDLAIGDPCEIQAAWRVDLDGYNSFCEPTVADGRVYISTDTRLDVFALETGAAINTIVSGSPVVFDENRGNVSVDDGGVYVTLGTSQSLSRWDADLTTMDWMNGMSSGTGPLGATASFGVTAVYDIGGTEVVVVGTEGGHLWCFRTSDGALFGGWPTNPVILDEGILHSPAYDGDDLYVATASANFDNGSIYCIDAATGQVQWNWHSTHLGEGYPSGLSLDANYIYAASAAFDLSGHRVKLTKSGSVVWEFAQPRSLYGPPAVGHNFLFIPLDGTYGGVFLIDKLTGAPYYNYTTDGIGEVTQHVTLTCDGYLFVGDRYGRWWLADDRDFNTQLLHRSEFGGIVNGTALATDPATGHDYAVVSIRSGNPTDGYGQLLAFQLNAGSRPRVAQGTPVVDIHVPLDAPASDSHTEPDLLTNIGCDYLTIDSHNITDPPPDPVAQTYNDTYSRYAAGVTDGAVGKEFTAYVTDSKAARINSRYHTMVDGELTRGDVELERAAHALIGSDRLQRQMRASAHILRTSSVNYSPVLPVGVSTDVSWTYNTTGLERGIDIEVIEFITNDPDRVFFGDQPTLTIEYKGGCVRDSTRLSFGDIAPDKSEYLYNTGHIGNGTTDNDLIWEGVTGHLYDGSLILCGDSLFGDAGTGYGGAEFHASFFDAGGLIPTWPGHYLPNTRPSDGACDFDGAQDILLGYKRVNGCPGTPQEIRGEWARSYFIDTNRSVLSGSPLAAIGVEVIQTEVGRYDPLYGDFKIIRWELRNRDVANKTLYAGSLMDWDVGHDASDNVGFVSDAFNGYAIWNATAPTVAFGMFEPDMPTDFATVDPDPHSPHRIHLMANPLRLWCTDPSYVCMTESAGEAWHFCVNHLPSREKDPLVGSDPTEDVAGLLMNEPIVLAAGGDAVMHQILFGVDAASGDSATIEASVLDLAERAAKWAGFARGDVNDDGTVDVRDVCWLLSGHQLYPDEYNGDVDLSDTVDMADQNYLLQYVTGLGPPPLGQWRFEF